MDVQIYRPLGGSDIVLCCDHASNDIPLELQGLGLSPYDLARHIAWDMGAAGLTRALSEILDAPAILCGTSRLVVDCNRHPDAADLIPECSDKTIIPGNMNLSPPDRESRLAGVFHPYHAAIAELLRVRLERGQPTRLVSIHTMTDCLGGISRPWEIAISSYHDRRMADSVLAALGRLGDINVGDNQPYDLDPDVDYTIPHHAMAQGLPHLQVEFRQDEIGTPEAQWHWAERLAQALLEPFPALAHSCPIKPE